MNETTVIAPELDLSLSNFVGDVDTSSELPSKDVIAAAAEIPVLDAEGKERPFKSLYTLSKPGGQKRVLVIFVRHFFCGNCQEYLHALSSSIPSPAALPADTEIAVVGCGAPSLIQMYAEATGCPFPIYTDPKSRLYEVLGMIRTLSPGDRHPQYIRSSILTGTVKGIVQGIRRLHQGDAFKSGDIKQVGGEFLFETISDFDRGNENKTTGTYEPGVISKVTWCHRMANTRDHTEIDALRQILRLDPVSSDQNKSPQSDS